MFFFYINNIQLLIRKFFIVIEIKWLSNTLQKGATKDQGTTAAANPAPILHQLTKEIQHTGTVEKSFKISSMSMNLSWYTDSVHIQLNSAHRSTENCSA